MRGAGRIFMPSGACPNDPTSQCQDSVHEGKRPYSIPHDALDPPIMAHVRKGNVSNGCCLREADSSNCRVLSHTDGLRLVSGESWTRYEVA